MNTAVFHLKDAEFVVCMDVKPYQLLGETRNNLTEIIYNYYMDESFESETNSNDKIKQIC